MAGGPYYLSESDHAKIVEALRRTMSGRGNNPKDPRGVGQAYDPQGSPEVYIAKPVTGVIPARSGLIPGAASCYVYKLRSISGVWKIRGVFLPSGSQKKLTVYNIWPAEIDSFTVINRDKFGRWFSQGLSGGSASGSDSSFEESSGGSGDGSSVEESSGGGSGGSGGGSGGSEGSVSGDSSSSSSSSGSSSSRECATINGIDLLELPVLDPVEIAGVLSFDLDGCLGRVPVTECEGDVGSGSGDVTDADLANLVNRTHYRI